MKPHIQHLVLFNKSTLPHAIDYVTAVVFNGMIAMYVVLFNLAAISKIIIWSFGVALRQCPFFISYKDRIKLQK